MGRKGSWFSSVRKIFNPHSKKYQERQRSIEEEVGKQDDLEAALPIKDSPFAVSSAFTPTEGFKFSEVENERSKRAYSVALATAVAAEAAVAAAKAAAEVVRLTNVPIYLGKSKEEMAAIKIQTAFRGYLARRALRALKGLVRLKKLIEGKSVKRQSASTLQCMQTLTRLQSQVRERRSKMSEENQALQQQLQQKHEKEAEKLHAFQIAEDWNDSTRSKEQVEARKSKRQEAAIRRERAMAYAFSHQQKWRNSKSVNPNTFTDPNNPHWGWSWVDRWMVVRPSESQSAIDYSSDHGSFKSASSQPMSVGQVTKLYSLRDQQHNTKPSRAGQKSSLPSKIPAISSTSHKARAASSKGSSWGRDDDSRSSLSVQSERYYHRRHTISGSLPRDDESLASSPAVPSYKVSTKPSNPKSRLRTASSSTTSPSADKKGTAQKEPLVSVKKRLSFPDSPTGSSRKHSVPPKVYASDGANGR